MKAEIILGTVQFGLNYGINNAHGKPAEETVTEILNQAYRSGIKKLDTADAYGNAQRIIGNFHLNNNFKFDVNTKFKNVSEGRLGEQLLRSLDELCIDKVNTWFYHSFTEYIENPECLSQIIEIKDKGLIRQIGVSVYSNFEFEKVINDTAIDIIQLPFNLLDNKGQRGALLEKAKKANKTIQVRSVFLQGLFFKDITELPVFLYPLKPYLKRLKTLSIDYDISMEDLCLQYVIAQESIDEIIIGVDSTKHLLKNLDSLNSGLDHEVCKAIDSIQVSEQELLYPYNWK